MQTQKKHKKHTNKEGRSKKREIKCGLLTDGICNKLKCNNQFHKNIKMDIQWIQNHVLPYIKEMLRLETAFSAGFLKGASTLIKNQPNLRENISYIPIAQLVQLFEIYSSHALFFAKILEHIPDGLYRFMNALTPSYTRDMFEPVKNILRYHKQNLDEWPIIQSQIQINSIFVFVRRTRDELTDNLVMALYQYYCPEARRIFLRKLQQEFGDDYYLIRKIQKDYNLPHHSAVQKKKDYSAIQSHREKVLNDRANGYVLPSDVSICYINSLRTLRIEITSMVREKVLGWDSEWFAPISRPQYPHLIQISGRKRVWIIDGIWLKQNASEELNSLLSILTSAKRIFHVFKGKEDILLIKKLQELPCFKQMELCVDVDRILDHLGFMQCSLAAETAFFLGKRLIKKDTMSDWTQRPLDQSQLYYAALDAFATRKIYLKAAYMILNNVPASSISKNMEDYKQTRKYEQKKTLDFPYRVVSSKSLETYLKESAVLCDDYLE